MPHFMHSQSVFIIKFTDLNQQMKQLIFCYFPSTRRNYSAHIHIDRVAFVATECTVGYSTLTLSERTKYNFFFVKMFGQNIFSHMYW